MAMSADGLNPTSIAQPSYRLTPEELCERYAVQICRFANLVASRSGEADDVAQEALLKAMRALPTYREDRGTLDAWLWRIVVNTAKDASRSRFRRLRLHVRLGTVPARAHPNAENIAVATGDLRSALAHLPQRDRTLIALRFGADMEIEQVSLCLDASPAATRKALQRAVERLKTELKGSDDA